MIGLNPTTVTANAVQPEKRNVWVRRLDLAEIPDLPILGKPSDRNYAVWHDTVTRHLHQTDRQWFGGKTPADLETMVRQGWPEGGRQAAELARQIEREMPEPVSRKRLLTWRDNGDELDRDKVYSGKLDTAWRSTRRVNRLAPQIISIVTNWGDNAGVSASEMFWSAAGTIALTDLLEKAGYSVELRALDVADNHNGGCRHYSAVEVMVKHPNEPLRPDGIAGALHAGVFRTYGIPALAGTPHTIDSGYGFALPMDRSVEILTTVKLADPAHLIFERAYSLKAAKQGVLNLLQQLESGNLAALDEA